MDIPPEIAIKSTIKPGSVYYFYEESFKTAHPHYFVVLNTKPLEDDVAILVCAVTLDIKTIEAKERLGYKRGETLFDVAPSECPLFKRPTLFDCNVVFLKTLPVLIEKLNNGDLALKGTIPDELLKKLRLGALASRQVEHRYKKLII